MSLSDLYIAFQKYVPDVFGNVIDFLTVFSWLSICFALRITLFSMPIKAFYVRTLLASLTLSPTSSWSHSRCDPATSNFRLFLNIHTHSYRLIHGHSSLYTKFHFLLLYPKSHSTPAILEDFLTPPRKSRGSLPFVCKAQ